jgi:hypothetical protein|tara:strand:+ start:6506 stop:7069 length:564 start_codon:yes stop_codon:yes gene_type:complete
MVSKWHKRLIQTSTSTYGGLLTISVNDSANYVDVLLSYSEVCFMMSEFILKGYTGDAENWYTKTVESSLTTYDMIGDKQNLDMAVAGKWHPSLPVSTAEVTHYLATPEVAFNGTDDLEKVYVQSFLNFFRLPSQGWLLSMYTGYPKYNSSVFSRFPKYNNEIIFLRRIPTPEPGDLNRENWDASRQS